MTQAILRTRHGSDPSPQSLPSIKVDPYAGDVPDSSDLRRFRLDQTTWDEYGELVGNGGRSGDLKAYIEWRLDNPDTPLPGKRRGPLKKSRTPRAAAKHAAGKAQADEPGADG
jgi:hypothetical protein